MRYAYNMRNALVLQRKKRLWQQLKYKLQKSTKSLSKED